MAFELLCSGGVKNLTSIDKVFLCLTASIAVFVIVCVVLMGS